MSDKEKLAYFLRILDDNFTLKTYAGIELTYEELHYLTEKLAKEIEYRERVQELDKELEQREIDSMEAHYRNKNHVSELKEHNNRYREYFQKVINTDERLVDKQYFKDIANEALESESE